jgi:hypothetical protein
MLLVETHQESGDFIGLDRDPEHEGSYSLQVLDGATFLCKKVTSITRDFVTAEPTREGIHQNCLTLL